MLMKKMLGVDYIIPDYDFIKNNMEAKFILNLESMNREEAIKVFEEYNNKEDKEMY